MSDINTEAEISSFVNDSAMMIAYERDLETKRGDDALFHDYFAEKLASNKGKSLSDEFEAKCTLFGLNNWPEFHKTWTAVRTKFIDDLIEKHAGSGQIQQIVNLGAGMDTRPYRLNCYSAFSQGSFAVDMAIVNTSKAKVFADFLNSPSPHCAGVHNLDLDFLSEDE